MACRLARLLALPHIELDALYWGPNWTPAPKEHFRESVREALSGDRWVMDGNYSAARDVTWQRADTLLWLDYAFVVVMGRLLLRTARRILRKEPLWNENREDLRTTIFSRDSILLWGLTTYGKRRRTYPGIIARPEHAHLAIVRLRSPWEARHWLDDVRRELASPTTKKPSPSMGKVQNE